MALKKHNILRPCTDEIAAKYREKTFYFSSIEARDSFLENPVQFVAQTEPLKVRADKGKERKSQRNKRLKRVSCHLLSQPPVLRIFLLGTRGAGKTTNGEWLARQLGIFHIQFREQLQTLIVAKTQKRVPDTGEVDSFLGSPEDLEALIAEARGEVEEETEEMEDDSSNMSEKQVSF